MLDRRPQGLQELEAGLSLLVRPCFPHPHDVAADSEFGTLVGNYVNELPRHERGAGLHSKTVLREVERNGGALDLLSLRVADEHEGKAHPPPLAAPRFGFGVR
jgi:hypothetical protein